MSLKQSIKKDSILENSVTQEKRYTVVSWEFHEEILQSYFTFEANCLLIHQDSSMLTISN